MTPATPSTAARPDPTAALRTWLNQAQQDHAAQPQAVADGLAERAATLPADATGAMALRLAEHVVLAHLAAPEALRALLGRLPAALAQAEPTATALRRIHWCLATLAGEPAPTLDDGPRWTALQNVVLAWAAQQRSGQAAALLAAEAPAALTQGPSDAGKAFAMTANNIAGDLQTGPRGDAARDALMLQAAALAREAWARAGTWLHVERADYRLALCHAVLGQGEAAVQHARQCLAGCEAAGADALEHYFGHEALARAQLAAGDGAAAAAAVQRMRALLPQIDEADGLRAWCAEVLQTLPA